MKTQRFLAVALLTATGAVLPWAFATRRQAPPMATEAPSFLRAVQLTAPERIAPRMAASLDVAALGPPLHSWLLAAAFRVAGIRERAAVIVQALVLLGALLATARAAQRRGLSGVGAAVLLLSLPITLRLSRLWTADLLTLGLVACAMTMVFSGALRSARQAAGLGFVIGLGALASESALYFTVPAMLAAALVSPGAERRGQTIRAALALCVGLLLTSLVYREHPGLLLPPFARAGGGRTELVDGPLRALVDLHASGPMRCAIAMGLALALGAMRGPQSATVAPLLAGIVVPGIVAALQPAASVDALAPAAPGLALLGAWGLSRLRVRGLRLALYLGIGLYSAGLCAMALSAQVAAGTLSRLSEWPALYQAARLDLESIALPPGLDGWPERALTDAIEGRLQACSPPARVDLMAEFPTLNAATLAWLAAPRGFALEARVLDAPNGWEAADLSYVVSFGGDVPLDTAARDRLGALDARLAEFDFLEEWPAPEGRVYLLQRRRVSERPGE